MEEAEFLMEYVRVMTKYSNIKIIFGISWFAVILTLFMLCRYALSMKNGLVESRFSESDIATIMEANIIIIVMILISAGLIL